MFVDFTDFYSDIAVTDLPLLVSSLAAIERLVLSSATKVITVSDEMAEALIQVGTVREKICVIPDGTDEKMFNPSVSGDEKRIELGLDTAPVIIYHGDIKHPDGVDILFEAFKKVVAEIPEAKLLILGGGGAYFEELKATMQQSEVGPSVVFMGWVPHAEVPKYIAAADVGAMPMRAIRNHECYLSFKLFEYWGVGKPIVTSRLRAISKVVQNGVNGLIVEPEDPDALADAFVQLIADPQKAKEMGMEGRRLVENVFNWDAIMEKELALYQDMVAHGRLWHGSSESLLT